MPSSKPRLGVREAGRESGGRLLEDGCFRWTWLDQLGRQPWVSTARSNRSWRGGRAG